MNFEKNYKDLTDDKIISLLNQSETLKPEAVVALKKEVLARTSLSNDLIDTVAYQKVGKYEEIIKRNKSYFIKFKALVFFLFNFIKLLGVSYFVLYLFFAVLVSCQKGQQKIERSNGDTEWIDPNTIQQGPIICDSLTFNQLENIKYLYNTFKEVDPTSQEKWIEDFMRDQNPDREIEIWMMMANAYNSYLKKGDFEIAVKEEVYKIVLMRSSAPEDEVIAHLDLVHLSEKEAREIMQAYKLEAKPMRVIQE